VKTVVIGLGNPIVSDDAVGIRVAREVQAGMEDRLDVEFREMYSGGLRLMEIMQGFDRAIVIDAMNLPQLPPGTIREFFPGTPLQGKNLFCTHDTSLEIALETGRALGLALPQELIILGIQAQDLENFSEVLTDRVEQAVPEAVARVKKYLGLKELSE
jgi:hydrogenase maturation protease